jgi:hypothetical protein
MSNSEADVRCGAGLRLNLTTEWYEDPIYFQQTDAGDGRDRAGRRARSPYNHDSLENA